MNYKQIMVKGNYKKLSVYFILVYNLCKKKKKQALQ